MALNEVTANGITVRLFPAQMTELLRGPQGPVYRALIVQAEDVRQEAKRRCPVSDGIGRDLPGSRGPHRPPGTLRDSIVKRPALVDGEIAFFVGSEDPVALMVHEGTVPHTIVPRRAKLLRFYSKRAGKVVYAKRVNHPGTRPTRFLTEALSAIRGR